MLSSFISFVVHRRLLAVCATLAVLNGAVWFRNRSSANGVFAIMAACSTAVSVIRSSKVTIEPVLTRSKLTKLAF